MLGFINQFNVMRVLRESGSDPSGTLARAAETEGREGYTRLRINICVARSPALDSATS